MLVYSLSKVPVTWDILVIIKVKLDGMLNTERVFNTTGFYDEQTHPTLCHCLVVNMRSFAHMAGGLKIECPAGGLYYSVTRFRPPNRRRLK
jgi:hypothetical protein